METTLLLKTDDIAKLTSISGNVDPNKLVPFIKLAQKTDITRILTKPLYDKILADFETQTLAGEYLFIYENFVVDMLSYFSSKHFVKMAPYQITNGGVYKATSPDIGPIDYEEVTTLVQYYETLGNGIELMFYDYMKDNSVSEYTRNGCEDNSNLGFNWYIF